MVVLEIPFEPGFNRIGIGPSWLCFPDSTVYLRCQCGAIIGQITEHSIGHDGAVDEEVGHQRWDARRKECSWRAEVRLQGWIDGIWMPGEQKLARKKYAEARCP